MRSGATWSILSAPGTKEEALDKRRQVSSERPCARHFACREGTSGATALNVEHADGRPLKDGRAQHRFDVGGLNAGTILEAWVENRRGANDDVPDGECLRDDAPGDDGANYLHLFVRIAGSAPPGRTLIRVEDLEVSLVGAEHAHDEAQRFLEERSGVVPIAQAQQSQVKIALFAKPLVVDVRNRFGHTSP